MLGSPQGQGWAQSRSVEGSGAHCLEQVGVAVGQESEDAGVVVEV